MHGPQWITCDQSRLKRPKKLCANGRRRWRYTGGGSSSCSATAGWRRIGAGRLNVSGGKAEKMSDTHNVIQPEIGVPIRTWTRGVAIDPRRRAVAATLLSCHFPISLDRGEPDVHWGIGATSAVSFRRKARSFLPLSRRYRMRNDGGPDDAECPEFFPII